MKTLYIDTHLWDIVIILFEDGKIVDKQEVINKKNNSEYIFPTIIKVIDGKSFDEIIVVNGPGSFTGVRLGVTIAKTLAYTLKLPIKTVTALECLAVSGNQREVALSDGNGYYVGIFDDNNIKVRDYAYLNNNEFNIMNSDGHVLVNTNLDYEKIYKFVKENKDYENAHAVKPIYIKKIGVELAKDKGQ